MTKEAKHTPGPWVWMDQDFQGRSSVSPATAYTETDIDDANKHGEINPHHLRGQNGDDVISPVWQNNDDASLALTPADARLIAAAPDLLAACEAVLHEEDEAARGNRGLSVICDEEIFYHLSEKV